MERYLSLFLKNLEVDVDASLRKGEGLKEWVGRKVSDAEEKLNSAERKLELISSLKKEGLMLDTLGENVL